MAESEMTIDRYFDLKGKIAIITGAGRGIGLATAHSLARAGADVALVARSNDELAAAAQTIQGLGRRAVAFTADLSQCQRMSALVAEIADTMGGIDILVNNAGTNIPQDSVDVTEDAWDTIMNINLKGAFFMAQAVGKVMIDQGRGGRIINVSSQTGSIALAKLRGSPRFPWAACRVVASRSRARARPGRQPRGNVPEHSLRAAGTHG